MATDAELTIVPHLGSLKALAQRAIPVVSTEKSAFLVEAVTEIDQLQNKYADAYASRERLEWRQVRILALLDCGGAFKVALRE